MLCLTSGKQLLITNEKYMEGNQYYFDECVNVYVKPKSIGSLDILQHLHKKSDYERLAENLLRSCREGSWPADEGSSSDSRGAAGRDGPAGRLLEGAWHLLFGRHSRQHSDATQPPYCSRDADGALRQKISPPQITKPGNNPVDKFFVQWFNG